MKRSEFLETLYEKVEKFFEDSRDENLVDFIVDECIKMGMLPPESEFLYKREIDDNLTVNFYKTERKWELEHE